MKCAPFKQDISAPLHITSALSYTSKMGPVAPPGSSRLPTASQLLRNAPKTSHPSLLKKPQISRLHFHVRTSLQISRRVQTSSSGYSAAEGVRTTVRAALTFLQPTHSATHTLHSVQYCNIIYTIYTGQLLTYVILP
jgi:hypothetical protein